MCHVPSGNLPFCITPTCVCFHFRPALQTLSPVTLGTSADLLVGQRVYAIGNPFGLDHSLSSGIISGLNRQLNAGLFPIRNVIQVTYNALSL